ncbi:MAG: tetratricopeptide repeat protein [Gallionella sp.]|nr:tetratricopeptide repeat protein [Gallionella sp.]
MIINAQIITRFFTPKVFFLISLLFWGFSAFSQNQTAAASACGTLFSQGQFGPYDYRTDRDKLPIVEGAHFTPEVEALIRGKTGSRPGGDIDYTLRAFPNNHRALMAMMRLGEMEKTPKPSGSRYTVECWFERAVLFRHDDAVVRMIYSSYLTKNNRRPEAVAQLEQATVTARENAFTHYNIGLLYFDMKIYDKSLARAHRALELGFERDELRDLLKNVGQWQEPSVEPKPQQ